MTRLPRLRVRLVRLDLCFLSGSHVLAPMLSQKPPG